MMISALLLAAGGAIRMGKPKQLLPFGKSTILEQTIDNLLGSQVDEIVVVVGHRAKEIAKVVALKPVKLVVNPDYTQGMSTSIIVGLNAVNNQAKAFMIVLGDEPLIDSRTVNELIEAFCNHDRGIVIPTYQGRRGHPVIFTRKYRRELLALRGDVGGRKIIGDHPGDVLEVAISCRGICLDIDTPDDLSLEGSKISQVVLGGSPHDRR
jgi:molybdenum cofactor cytidylyltransferase